MTEHLYFLAVLPPEPQRTEIQFIREEFAHIYNCKHALKSPPHITLIPPFWMGTDQQMPLREQLGTFSAKVPNLSVELSGYGAYKPRVIYLNVVENAQLNDLQRSLASLLSRNFGIKEDTRRVFRPHLSVAFKDLSRTMFYKAWDLYRSVGYVNNFTVNYLTLLKYEEKIWKEDGDFIFGEGL